MTKIEFDLSEESVPLKVFAVGSYYNQSARVIQVATRHQDYEAHNFQRIIFAIKDEGVLTRAGYTARTIGSERFTISRDQPPEKNLSEALGLVKALVGPGIPWPELGFSGHDRLIVVPVPSTDATVNASEPIRWGPRHVAHKVFQQPCVEVVRFRDPPPKKATCGGPRNAHGVREHLTVYRPPEPGTKRALIVDDVVTSGGHMQAVAMVLKQDLGIEEVAGFCIGATVSSPVDDPWESMVIDIPPEGRTSY